MKYPLLAGLLLLAACGNNATSSNNEPTASKTVEKPATTDLDLTSYGVPVVLAVPAGTTAKKDTVAEGELAAVLIKGPKIAMKATVRESTEETARIMADATKKLVQGMGAKVEIDEPLAMLATIDNPAIPFKITWAATTVLPGGKVCSFSMQDEAMKFSEADMRAMFTIARAAKPTGK